MNYYAFDAVGNIVRQGNYTENTQHLYISTEYTLVNGEADMQRNFVRDGRLCEYTPEQVQARAAPPGLGHVWLPSLGRWVDQRTLKKLKDDKWAEIKGMRDALESTSFSYLGKEVQADIKSVLRINIAVQAADHAQSQNAMFATEWRCADNTLLSLDGPGMQKMPLALAAHAQQLHRQANGLRSRIESATSKDELDNVVW